MLHNGITATILDEGLCACGFSSLPSKRGVTANLTIDFKNQAQPQSTVVLRAKVAEAKGRKVVIDGTLSTFPTHLGEKPMEIASAKCVLVEPKWFKYFLSSAVKPDSQKSTLELAKDKVTDTIDNFVGDNSRSGDKSFTQQASDAVFGEKK
ncbi:hypothetical protein SBP28_004180 [Candidozyma auris]|nr:hypothetical protein CJJ09_004337 [[Candida] auris]